LKLRPCPGARSGFGGPANPGGKWAETAQPGEAAGDDGEGLKPDSTFAQADEVHVPAAMADAEVSVPEETVSVGVGDIRCAMEGEGVHRNSGLRG